MTKDEAQRSRWTFYEAVNFEMTDAKAQTTREYPFLSAETELFKQKEFRYANFFQ